MPETKPPAPPSPTPRGERLAEMELRQDRLIAELDRLNDRIERALLSIVPPKEPVASDEPA